MTRSQKDRLIQNFFFLVAGTSILVLFLIMIFLFSEGIPLFFIRPQPDVVKNEDQGYVEVVPHMEEHLVSPWEFVSSTRWNPTKESDPGFGILAIIIGSVSVTVVSSVIAIPLGVMTAIYLAEIAGPRTRNIVKPVVEMLEALPSVVIGFFGIVIVAPFVMELFDKTVGPSNGFLNVFDIADGSNLLVASVMLAFMAVPTITSISEDSIFSVSDELREASLALGATHWQTIRRVVVPASMTGITTAIILGMARSIGETMVVLMVSGNANQIPHSLFDSVRPMPASIASEMGEAAFRTDHYHALFATGVVLFFMTLLFNIIAAYISEKKKQVGAATL